MHSYIIASTACKSCATLVDKEKQRVLRTATQEICTTCGAIVNNFPAFVLSPAAGNELLGIPEQVSTILENLLRRRLFGVLSGISPTVGGRIGEYGNPPSHRIGDQVVLELGFGNTEATIRWNFSDAELYRKAHQGEKPRSLDSVDWLMPTRIRRAADFVGKLLDFKSATITERSWSGPRSLRFEKSFALDEQPLATAKLCLVVKVELSWLQVGESLPSEDGPREFYLRPTDRRPFLTVEEALDKALFIALRNHGQHVDAKFYHAGKHNAVCDFDRSPIKTATPLARLLSSRADFYGAVSVNNYRALYPSGMEQLMLSSGYHFEKVVVEFNGERILETSVPNNAFFERCSNVNIVGIGEKLDGKLGTLVVRFPGEPKMAIELEIVPQHEYERAYAHSVEQAKIEKLREVKRMLQFWEHYAVTGHNRDNELPSDTLLPGEKVAVELSGQWWEGTYESRADGKEPGAPADVPVTTSNGSIAMVTPARQMRQYIAPSHLVLISSPGGTARWSVVRVKRLDDALREGIHVIAPFDSRLSQSLTKLQSFVPTT